MNTDVWVVIKELAVKIVLKVGKSVKTTEPHI